MFAIVPILYTALALTSGINAASVIEPRAVAATKPVNASENALAAAVQYCSTWATTQGGKATACGANATYDADTDDMCDKKGTFCRAICCDFNSDDDEFDSVLSNIFGAIFKGKVQTCDAWATKAGGAAKACGTGVQFTGDSDDYCDSKGTFCKIICCDDDDDDDDDDNDNDNDNDDHDDNDMDD